MLKILLVKTLGFCYIFAFLYLGYHMCFSCPQPSSFSCISSVSDSSLEPPLILPPGVTLSCGILLLLGRDRSPSPPLQGITRRSVKRSLEGWGAPINMPQWPEAAPIPFPLGGKGFLFAIFFCILYTFLVDNLMKKVLVSSVQSLTWSSGSRLLRLHQLYLFSIQSSRIQHDESPPELQELVCSCWVKHFLQHNYQYVPVGSSFIFEFLPILSTLEN